jgi:hypothetical protein
LRKGSRLSKFEKKCDEGFLLGYSSNSKAYRVFNKTHGIIEEAYDIEFDETDGSQDEKNNLDDVGGIQLRNAMKTMSIGEINPKEDDDDSVVVITFSSTLNEETHQSQQNDEVEDDHVQNISSQSVPSQASTSNSQIASRIHHLILKDHPVNQIVGDISKGVQTHSHIASFCEHFSFVSCIDPNLVDEALLDVDWVNAMHEELNNFTLMKFESLLRDQRTTMLLVPNGCFEASIMKELKDEIFVSQSKYLKDMLKKFGLENAKPIKTPMATNGHLDLDEVGTIVDQKLFRSIIGSLLYVTASRPNVMFSVCMCACFQASPREVHLKATKRILRYLKHTPNIGLWYPKGAQFELIGYLDSDYVGCKVSEEHLRMLSIS